MEWELKYGEYARVGKMIIEVELTGESVGACTVWADNGMGPELLCHKVPWSKVFNPDFHVVWTPDVSSATWCNVKGERLKFPSIGV